jgi:GT2 family glycosyltransferase/glycosyltransferase involved in cell wall biosynthesis
LKRPPLIVDYAPARARALAAWERGEATPGELGLQWLERAHRLAASDQNLCFALAARRLNAGQPEAAAVLFEAMARRHNVPECWAGLAAAHLDLGDPETAAAALQPALSTSEATPALTHLAARIVGETPRPGWCGLRADGVLLTDVAAAQLSLHLDGKPIDAEPVGAGEFRLPHDWAAAQRLEVTALGELLLGSPIAIAAILRLEGVVSRAGSVVSGFAWHPGAPRVNPVVRLLGEDGAVAAEVTATEWREAVEGTAPLTRHRVFSFAVPPGQAVRVLGEDGRDLLGSPLPPKRRRRTPPRRSPAAHRDPDPGGPVDVVIPVYRGLRETLDCLGSVLATVAAPHRVVVVNDASPEPDLVAALAALAHEGRIELIHTGPPGAPNRGFPAAVNAGLLHAAGRHVILLNSDTLVAPGWLETLREAACSAADIGTATAFSNEASIFSYPKVKGGNPPPDLQATRLLAGLALAALGTTVVDVPTAHGFCMFIRADCLEQTGAFDTDSFAQGYGEENDFTERARLAGWRHVAAPGVFVAHHGGVSFGGARLELLARNLAILDARYPTYRARVAEFIAADGLASARRRLDEARWLARATTGPAVLLISHGIGGGTARVVAERAAALRAEGLTPVVLSDAEGLCEVGEAAGGFPNLLYDLPDELPALIRLLQAGRPVRAEIHHLLGHDHSIMGVLAALGLPYDVWVHDYAWFCARVSFVTGENRFCGEAEPSVCEDCLARWGRGIEDPIGPAALRRRSATDLAGASSIVVPSEDVGRRVARHAPGAQPLVRAWEADPSPMAPAVVSHTGTRHVVVVGAIGPDKGYDVLLGCAADAAARGLDLMFTVVGYTVDDDALLATERAFITGEFKRGEAGALIRAQRAHLAFLPSIWPETWCYALSDIWSAGLSAALFDIGTPAERVRRVGRGWLLPLGLPASRVNEVLLNLR